MPLIVTPFLQSDIHDFAVADADAVKHHNWNFARAMEIPGVSRVEFVETWTRKGWGKDPLHRWMKVCDSETGEFVFLLVGSSWRAQELDREVRDLSFPD